MRISGGNGSHTTLAGVTASQHHDQTHADQHLAAGTDPVSADGVATIATLRSLAFSELAAAPGLATQLLHLRSMSVIT